MIVATNLAAVLLAVAAVAAVFRVVRGPSVADRMVALDTLLFVGVAGIGAYIARTGETTFVPVLVMAVLTAFVSTVVVARYIEAETER
ncbi:MAG: cation:proton antiporter [Acidimicrobiia bacterium]|nr:cation:proton antiporter [Acidimicrobiia bacterium]MBT8194538.1 cation:proton antiporter [Acidimicrobiia bacterium]MBT8246572.1 cation:proton antiporter [Acidimicrobiia bacterium]NNF88936.1 cation:proton antiporter [Acidimicrobiia bacterium]NNJ48198.1 cation:proton antiporter [Acidimicrobiia bacterium]